MLGRGISEKIGGEILEVKKGGEKRHNFQLAIIKD